MTANASLPAAASWRRGLIRIALAGLLSCGAVLVPGAARASDDLGTGDAAVSSDGPKSGIQPTTTPDNLGCSASAARASTASASAGTLAGLLVLLSALAYRQRSARRRRLAAGLAAACCLAAVSPVLAQQQPTAASSGSAAQQPAVQQPAAQPPNDPSYNAPAAQPPQVAIALYKPDGKRRHFTISYNPLTLLLSRYGLNAEIMLASHHVLIGSAYYAYTHTNEDSNNIFKGFGGEVGYRFYFGKNGPRGLYLGPSFLIGHFDAIPAVGATINYWNYGGALDLGYQYLVADRVTLGLGGGVQYTVPTVDFPAQELPASVYAIKGVRPRLLLALGVAF